MVIPDKEFNYILIYISYLEVKEAEEKDKKFDIGSKLNQVTEVGKKEAVKENLQRIVISHLGRNYNIIK